MPTLKSHRHKRQSSATEPKRYERSSQRQGSKATAVTHDWWPWQRAARPGAEYSVATAAQMDTISSCPPVSTYLPSGDQQTQVKPP